MGNSKGAAFYASGNVASEALRHHCTDSWTEAYAVPYAMMNNVCNLFVLGFDLNTVL